MENNGILRITLNEIRCRLQRFEQSRLRWTTYRTFGKSHRLGTDRIAARLHRRDSDDGTRAPIDLWCHKGVRLGKMCLDVDVIRQNRGWLSSAVLNSIHSEFKLMPRLSRPSFVTYFRFSLLSRLALLTLLPPMNFITVRVSVGNVSAHMSLHLCMSA